MAPPRALHLRIQLHVGVIGVVKRALTMIPLVCVILSPLSVLGEVAEEVERFAEGILCRSRECTRRVHRVRFMAGKRGSDMMLRFGTRKRRAQAGTTLLDPD